MSIAERRSFDRGFAHSYPESRGLREGLLEDSSRTIFEPLGSTGIHGLLVENNIPLFPSRISGKNRLHSLPSDSRDLTQVLRLTRDSLRTEKLGLVLGIRLYQIFEATHMTMSDTILPRFAVHSHASNSVDESGIDVKLLPPFDHIDPVSDLDDVEDMVLSEMLEMNGLPMPKIEDFLRGLSNGINSNI